jgi:hypothetical protein
MNTPTQEVILNALSRKRTRLAYKTSTSHEDLKRFLSDVMKPYNFNIIAPGVCADLDEDVPSSWPTARRYRWVLNALMEAGAKSGKWEQGDKEKARDKLDGHCGEMAFCLTNTDYANIRTLLETSILGKRAHSDTTNQSDARSVIIDMHI